MYFLFRIFKLLGRLYSFESQIKYVPHCNNPHPAHEHLHPVRSIRAGQPGKWRSAAQTSGNGGRRDGGRVGLCWFLCGKWVVFIGWGYFWMYWVYAKGGHDEKSWCRVLFTGPGVNFGVVDLERILSQTSVKYDIHSGLWGGPASSISLQASSVSRSFIGCLNS